jgi:hypothetical protein
MQVLVCRTFRQTCFAFACLTILLFTFIGTARSLARLDAVTEDMP